jgi:hypothetical protein
MHTVEITIPKRFGTKIRNRLLPSKWNELSREQLLFIAKLMNMELTEPQFHVYLLRRFLDLRPSEFFSITPLAIRDLSQTLSFILETKELNLQLLPQISVRKGLKKITLFGPESALVDATFEQFFFYTQPALADFTENKNEASLDLLIASLYTRKKGLFVSEDVDGIQRMVKRLHPKYKTAVLLFYMGCLDFFAYKFPELFSDAKKKKAHKRSDLYALELTDQLNGNNLSNNQHIKKTNLLEAFVRMTRMIEEAEQLKRQTS